MLPNAFTGKADPPSDEDLTHAVCASRQLWDELVAGVAALGAEERDWHSYSKKAGWALRLRHKDRSIVYLSPSGGGFMASFALGDNAVEAARRSDLPPHVIASVNASKRYAEGTAVRIEVRSTEDVQTVLTLAAIKLAH